MAHIFQINILKGGVPKLPMTQARVTPQGIEGDRQRNTQHHGGTERALCLYDLDKILALQAQGHPVFPGAMGENLTLTNLPWSTIIPGDQLRLGDEVLIQISSYSSPCTHLKPYLNDGDFNRVAHKKHPGWSRVYARVLQAGALQIGDKVTIIKETSDV